MAQPAWAKQYNKSAKKKKAWFTGKRRGRGRGFRLFGIRWF